ncbi:hypothetical protein AB3X91_11925 [Paraburkholderia sp. BR14263]|uniref:hypothetical protein n=1 Tax=unclassified Paraburkholderia TaxID=2615204 RepID=UPI0034CEAA27
MAISNATREGAGHVTSFDSVFVLHETRIEQVHEQHTENRENIARDSYNCLRSPNCMLLALGLLEFHVRTPLRRLENCFSRIVKARLTVWVGGRFPDGTMKEPDHQERHFH